MKFGHPLLFGEANCKMEKIENDEELRKDDEKKNEMRFKMRENQRQIKETCRKELLSKLCANIKISMTILSFLQK